MITAGIEKYITLIIHRTFMDAPMHIMTLEEVTILNAIKNYVKIKKKSLQIVLSQDLIKVPL